MWFGGVAMVARVVLAGPGEEDLFHATRAFSRMSTKAMVLVIVTGRGADDPPRRQPVQQQPRPGRAAQSGGGGGDDRRRPRGAASGRLPARPCARDDGAGWRIASAARSAPRPRSVSSCWRSADGCSRSSRPRSTSSRTRRTRARSPSSTRRPGIDARVFIGPAEVGRNGFRIEVNAPQEGITSLALRFYPPVESGQNVIRQDLALTTAGTLVLPTDKGIPFEVRRHVDARAQRLDRARNATRRAGDVPRRRRRRERGHDTSRFDRVDTLPVQVSVVDQSTTSAPFVTTTRHRRHRRPPPAVDQNGSQPDSASSSSKLTGLATSNCS